MAAIDEKDMFTLREVAGSASGNTPKTKLPTCLLVPGILGAKVSQLTANKRQETRSTHSTGHKMRDPGNEVARLHYIH